MAKIDKSKKNSNIADYYDSHSILNEIVEESVNLSLDTELRNSILSGKRKGRLRNISIKIDPLQLQAIRKIATMKSIPYQTLIRFWLSENIKRELHLKAK